MLSNLAACCAPADPTELDAVMRAAIAHDGPTLVDVISQPLEESAVLLDRARTAGIPIIHIQHDAGPGTPYDVNAAIGRIADIVAHTASKDQVTDDTGDDAVNKLDGHNQRAYN